MRGHRQQVQKEYLSTVARGSSVGTMIGSVIPGIGSVLGGIIGGKFTKYIITLDTYLKCGPFTTAKSHILFPI